MNQASQAPHLNLLLAEDNVLTALDLEAMVDELGHRVCAVVASGPEAVAAAQAHRPDLVLMDIRLAEGTDGIEAAQEIRSRLGIPAVFITGSGEPETRARAQAAHPLGFVTKPFSAASLRAALDAAAQAKHA